MFGLGLPELIIILVIILMVFGVGKLPEIGGAIGKGIRSFKKATKEPETPEGNEKKKEIKDRDKNPEA
ncbi:MAG: twin-arginine translocase TatA/TatE family subunit [Syntrophorhabdales bacterium]|nr:twin-arginine translocase TatA/TatE family subunit [Syntrophorhabdales bacterium]